MNKGDITPCDCGHDAVCVGLGTGYGTDSEGKKICYSCIGKLDREELISTGKQIGYLSFTCMIEDIRGRHEMLGTVYDSKGKYTNWPGTFSIDVHVAKRSRNNFGGFDNHP